MHPHLTYLSWFSVKIFLVEPSLDRPILFKLKKLACQTFVIYSGMFWPALDRKFGDYYLEIDR
jgi:hypothetical protein